MTKIVNLRTKSVGIDMEVCFVAASNDNDIQPNSKKRLECT